MAIKYDDSSISQLKGAERVRLRPEALLGSKGIDGARHTIYEIVGNASDEKTFAADRLCSRRLFSRRHEKTVSHGHR